MPASQEVSPLLPALEKITQRAPFLQCLVEFPSEPAWAWCSVWEGYLMIDAVSVTGEKGQYRWFVFISSRVSFGRLSLSGIGTFHLGQYASIDLFWVFINFLVSVGSVVMFPLSFPILVIFFF